MEPAVMPQDAPPGPDRGRWAELTQAYGTAEDIPRLMAALTELEDETGRAEVWFALWRMLWRPDAVFDAAYAAVPHLLAISARRPLAERVQAIHLAVRVELLRRTPAAPAMPADLVDAYGAAIESLPAAVLRCSDEPWTAEVARILAAALVAGKRQAQLAGEFLGPDDDDA